MAPRHLAVLALVFAYSFLLLGLPECSSSSTTSETENVSTGVKSAAWYQYWQQKIGGSRPPRSMANLASRVSAVEMTAFLEELDHMTVSTTDSKLDTTESMCSKGMFLCGEKASGPTVCVDPYFYEYSNGKCKRSESMSLQEGLFFRPEDLKVGHTILYPKLANDLQGRRFLPAEVSKAMAPVSLPQTLAMLHIPLDSDMADGMERTLSICTSPPVEEGEVRSCHSSIESMIDFSVEQLHGAGHISVLSLDHATNRPQQVRVLAKPRTISSPQQKSITCHDLTYPYLVYGCHVMASSRILDVTLATVEDGDTLHGIGVCHTDTRSWNAGHPAFAALHVKPGEGTICHWVPQNNFVWVATQN